MSIVAIPIILFILTYIAKRSIFLSTSALLLSTVYIIVENRFSTIASSINLLLNSEIF